MGERSDYQFVKDIPALPQDGSKLDPAVRQPLEQMRSAVQTLAGTRGDPLDQAITLRMGQKLGFLDGSRRFAIGIGSVVVPPGSTNPFADEPDLTPPPDVLFVTASAGFSQIIVQWPAAVYPQGHGNQQTNVYAVKKVAGDPVMPTFADAQLVNSATGELTIISLPSDLGIRWHIWVKYQSKDGVESINPAGGINGAVAQTGLIGGANLAPLSITAAALADGAVDLLSKSIKSYDQFGALAVGYTVTQYLLAKSGVMQNLIVDDAQVSNLSAAKLTVGDGTVGGNLKSAGYVAGTQGWITRPDGYSEFSNTIVRGGVFADYGYFTGTITAGAGAIGGALIGATYVQSTNYASGTAGWRWDNTLGKLFAASATIKKGTRTFDTDALGSSPVLQVDGAISILANGTATFSGDLTAGRVSVGTATSATRFFDPANSAISIMSSVYGVFVVSSYLYTGAAVTTGDDLKFKNNDSTWPIQRRLRTGSVYFSVIATATIDDQLSIWYRTNGGTWTFMASVTEPQAGDGSDAVAFGISITVTTNMVVEFGAGPFNSSYTAADMGKLYFRTLQVVVNGGNF